MVALFCIMVQKVFVLHGYTLIRKLTIMASFLGNWWSESFEFNHTQECEILYWVTSDYGDVNNYSKLYD